MWPTRPKQDYLPISCHEHSFLQKTVYQQPDLHDEEVPEFENIWSPVPTIGAASGTQLFSFLLIGDQVGLCIFQNAHKSLSWIIYNIFL